MSEYETSRTEVRNKNNFFACRMSHKLGPKVVRHEWRSGPAFTVHVLPLASEEAIMGVLDDRHPRGGFGMLHPLW
jgi:hypothetical protein